MSYHMIWIEAGVFFGSGEKGGNMDAFIEARSTAGTGVKH